MCIWWRECVVVLFCSEYGCCVVMSDVLSLCWCVCVCVCVRCVDGWFGFVQECVMLAEVVCR